MALVKAGRCISRDILTGAIISTAMDYCREHHGQDKHWPSLRSMFQIDELDPTLSSYDLPGEGCEYLVSLLRFARHSKIHLVSILPPR
jgi:hypothetical protein